MRSKYYRIVICVVCFVYCEQIFSQSTDGLREKPKHKWHISIGSGIGWIDSDVQSTFPNFTRNAAVRRNLNKWLSLQIQYATGVYMGMNHLASNNYGKNPVWASKYNAPLNSQAPPPALPGTFLQINSANRLPVTPGSLDAVYYNYRSVLHQFILDARAQKDITSLLNIYASLGIGAFTYNTKVDALDNSNRPYTTLFNMVNNNQAILNLSRRDVLNDLRAGMDLVYETPAEKSNQNIHFLPFQFGAGLAFHLSPRLQLGWEYQFSFTDHKLIDGQQWRENPIGDAALVQKKEKIHNVRMNLAFGF
jgi:opacity protein-like surface antigen